MAGGKVASWFTRKNLEPLAWQLGVTEECCDFSHQQCRLPRGRVASVRVGNASGTACSVGGHVCARVGGRPRHALKLLVPGWFHSTRLETRTKECNMRASLGVENLLAQ